MDITPVHQSLDQLHDRYSGDRLFILGTGPSLADAVPWLPSLRPLHTMGVNLLLRWPVLTWSPTFYVIQELRYWWGQRIQDNARMVLAREGIRLPPACFYGHIERVPELDAQGWTFVHQTLEHEMQNGAFAGFAEALPPVPFGSSVVMLGVMLGVWMGFKDIVLLGCDATKRGHVYERDLEANEPLERLRQDSFMRAALTAHEVMTLHGRRLLDASGPQGQLPLPKVRLEDLL